MFAVGSVLCPFLEDHREDILCGPVWLASGLDLSGHAGMLSLTSPKLVKGDAQSEARVDVVNSQFTMLGSLLLCRHGWREVPLLPGSHESHV